MSNKKIVKAKAKGLAWGKCVACKVVGGDLDGLTIFSENLIPGEIAKLELLEIKKNYAIGRTLEVLEKSTKRVEPECLHYDSCGGCSLQHIETHTAHQYKIDMINSALEKNSLAEIKIGSIHSDKPYQSRRRCLLRRAENGKFGFFKKGSTEAFGLEECPILEPTIEESINKINSLHKRIPKEIVSLFIETGSNNNTYAKLNFEKAIPIDNELISTIERIFENFLLVTKKEVLYQSGQAKYELQNSSYSWIEIPQGGFSQTNSSINKKLVEVALSEIKEESMIFDLYAGSGNFSIPFAIRGGKVCAVEPAKECKNTFLSAANKQGVKDKVQFHSCSTEKFIKNSSIRLKDSVILVDPPRAGLGKTTISGVCASKKLIYISCSLPSFIRDIKRLEEKGLKCQSIQAFDMFPQTTYVELLGVFEKRG